MPSNTYFQFKQFTVNQDRCAMKVTTDACLFGAWVAKKDKTEKVKDKNVLDIGTGTGLLSLMYAQKNPASMIDAIEIDKEAYEQAKENVAASPWSNRVNVLEGDAKTFSFTKKYDLIISNPPFYEKELKSADQRKNIALHDEALSLEELLTIIEKNSSPEGIFSLLLPYKRMEEIKKILEEWHILQITLVRQSTRHDYFRIMLTGEVKKENAGETMIDEIAIWNDNQQYTPEFTELLKDYYLYL